MADLPKIRWFAALVVATLSPAIALVLNRTSGHQLLAVGSWAGWVSSSITILMLVAFYILLESAGRKDALIPAKRHSYYLFFTLPPMVFLYEAFFSQPLEQ